MTATKTLTVHGYQRILKDSGVPFRGNGKNVWFGDYKSFHYDNGTVTIFPTNDQNVMPKRVSGKQFARILQEVKETGRTKLFDKTK